MILDVKGWENGKIDNVAFAKAIEDFCLNTQSVRLPVISFFLRLMLPHKFGTLDIHAVNALRMLGFKDIKEIPSDERNKAIYFQKYSGLDYLRYNNLLTETGRHYEIVSNSVLRRPMTPSEVDMALYMFDKQGKQGLELIPPHLDRKKKIEEIMIVLDGIASDVFEVANMPWAIRGGYSGMLKSSAEKLMNIMKGYAQKGDLEGIFRYYQSALGDPTVQKVGTLLKQCGKKSLESEYPKVKKIYNE